MMGSLGEMVLLAAFSSLVSALVPLALCRNGVKRGTLHVLLGASAGILFAIATVDLIPEGIAVSADYRGRAEEAQLAMRAKEGRAGIVASPHRHEEHDHAAHDGEFGRTVTMVGVGMGFFVLVLVEQLMLALGVAHSHQPTGKDEEEGGGGGGGELHSHAHAHEHDAKGGTGLSESFSLTAFAALGIHSLVDGVVIGGSFRVSADIGTRVAVAIVLHKVPDGFVVASLLTATNRSRKLLWVLALSSVTPFGAMVGYALLSGIPPSVLGGVLGFAAGTFLFIAATGIIPELLHEAGGTNTPMKPSIIAVVLGWAGVLVMNTLFHSH